MSEERVEAGVRSSIYLLPEVIAQLDAIAARRGSKRSVVIRELILAGLEREALVRRIAEAVA